MGNASNESTLQPVISLNREIASLAATGLPLDIGVQRGQDLDSALESISRSLATRIANGESIDQAIRNATDLPARYRTGLWAWIHHSDPTIALDSFAIPAESQREFGNFISRILFYPLLLISLAYCCVLVLCLYTAPALESLFRTIHGTAEPIAWLQRVERWKAVWIPAFPLLLLAGLLVWQFLRKNSNWKWIPGSEKYYRSVRYATLSKQLADLIGSGRTTEEALSLVTNTFQASTQPEATGISLPPLLKWAVSSKIPSKSLPGTLNLVAESYRQAADRHREFWRIIAPTVVGAALGGVIVMAYGLAMFLPIVELLYSVSGVSP